MAYILSHRHHALILLYVFLLMEFTTQSIALAQQNTQLPKNNIVLPGVDFISEKPVIDGILDKNLSSLPLRKFNHVQELYIDNEPEEASYIIGYGLEYLYIYIEIPGNCFTFRDRAYQHGDGFLVNICKPTVDGSPTNEFYIIGCSAVNDERNQWTKTFIWYNDYKLWKELKDKPEMETALDNGKLCFELKFPWSELHPYHPLFSGEIGFNLCLTKAVGEKGVNFHYVVFDPDIMSETNPRQFCRLTFKKPYLENSTRTFVQLSRNNIIEGEQLLAKAVTVSPDSGSEKIRIRTYAGEGEWVLFDTARYDYDSGVTKNEFLIPAAPYLPEGGYTFQWRSLQNESRDECFLSVIPNISLENCKEPLKLLEGKVASGSITTMEFLLIEAINSFKTLKPYETCARQRIQLARVIKQIDRAKDGNDDFNKKGYMRKAFRSDFDGTLQPYIVGTPDSFEPAKQYPLVVFLHSSGQDERGIEGFTALRPENGFILGPKARGTSNAFCEDNAQIDIAEAISEIVSSYSIDRKKIVLAGFSMGGYGVLRTYYETPDKFAGIAFFSGRPNTGPRWFPEGNHVNFEDPENLTIFKDVPIFIHHGRNDTTCPLQEVEKLASDLKKAGAKVTLVIDDEIGHRGPRKKGIEAYNQWLRQVFLSTEHE